MKLSDFINRIKLQNPNIGQQNITDDFLITLINQAVDQVNLIAQVYKTSTTFDIEANKMVYSLSEDVPLYLGRDKRGLYLNIDGSLEKLTPKTEDWICKMYPDYLNVSSVQLPIYYWVDGDDLGFYPPPNADISNGCKLYHLRKSTPMATSESYPFSGGSSEITSLIPLDDAILAYARWKLSPQFGNVTDTDLRYREFIQECRKGAMQIKRKPDQVNDLDQGMTA